jgi:hypothetical protein
MPGVTQGTTAGGQTYYQVQDPGGGTRNYPSQAEAQAYVNAQVSTVNQSQSVFTTVGGQQYKYDPITGAATGSVSYPQGPQGIVTPLRPLSQPASGYQINGKVVSQQEYYAARTAEQMRVTGAQPMEVSPAYLQKASELGAVGSAVGGGYIYGPVSVSDLPSQPVLYKADTGTLFRQGQSQYPTTLSPQQQQAATYQRYLENQPALGYDFKSNLPFRGFGAQPEEFAIRYPAATAAFGNPFVEGSGVGRSHTTPVFLQVPWYLPYPTEKLTYEWQQFVNKSNPLVMSKPILYGIGNMVIGTGQSLAQPGASLAEFGVNTVKSMKENPLQAGITFGVALGLTAIAGPAGAKLATTFPSTWPVVAKGIGEAALVTYGAYSFVRIAQQPNIPSQFAQAGKITGVEILPAAAGGIIGTKIAQGYASWQATRLIESKGLPTNLEEQYPGFVYRSEIEKNVFYTAPTEQHMALFQATKGELGSPYPLQLQARHIRQQQQGEVSQSRHRQPRGNFQIHLLSLAHRRQ